MILVSKFIHWLRDLWERDDDGCAVCGEDDHSERVISAGTQVPCAVVVCPEGNGQHTYV